MTIALFLMVRVCFAKKLFSEALLIPAIAVALSSSDDLEFVVEMFGVIEADFADAASPCQFAGEASVVFVTWAVHLRLSSLVRHIEPLPVARGYYKHLKASDRASFSFSEKSPGGDAERMGATVPTSLATRGLVLSAMLRTVYFFQRRERGEG